MKLLSVKKIIFINYAYTNSKRKRNALELDGHENGRKGAENGKNLNGGGTQMNGVF